MSILHSDVEISTSFYVLQVSSSIGMSSGSITHFRSSFSIIARCAASNTVRNGVNRYPTPDCRHRYIP